MKIILVSASQDSLWQSCKSITQGLIRSYKGLDPEFRILTVALADTTEDTALVKTADEIRRHAPDAVVFLDTWPIYGRLLAALSTAYPDRSEAPLLRFHCYGDFTLRAYQWLYWQSWLKGFRVEWACASEQQRRVVESLNVESSTWVCPFPVQTEEFEFSAKIRTETRRSLGFDRNDFVVLYTGRMSLQKNVVACLRAFAQLTPAVQKRTKMIFVGDFDDLCAPFDQMSLPRGGFFQLWQSELEKIGKPLRSNIRSLWGVKRKGLREMYCAADAFLSLSLVHDEDFGMAPAEGAVSGLPLILTGWGGYAGFKHLGLAGKWIPVTLKDKGPEFRLSDVSATLNRVYKMKRLNIDRQRRGRRAARKLSISAMTELLRVQSRKPRQDVPRFQAFHSNMNSLSNLFQYEKGHLVFNDCRKGSTYEQIYRNYVEL